ncbi:MAG: hypothetical protein EZS28_008996 [Streblomastix strix]|uniref:Tail specific protease domain-containing protein n=1 Tax=Streblomastix strix TaxID=222440 RepID=A0A5J4WLH4_9EUKA|nr:MAG: hypothetical protein EZS28_008996 [Streblomastix strix]
MNIVYVKDLIIHQLDVHAQGKEKIFVVFQSTNANVIYQMILDLEILVLLIVFAKLVMIQLLLVIAQVLFMTLDVHIIQISILQIVDASLRKIDITHLTMVLLLTSDEQSITISLLKEYLNSYAFIDTSLNPPGAPIGYGKHAVNIIISLDKINKSIYNNTFDFYEDIMVLLNNLKDPHTIFTPPCVSKFNYLFFNFKVNQNETDKSFYITVKIDDTDFIVNKINIQGLPLYIQVNDTEIDNNGTYPALEAIARWADEEKDLFSEAIFDAINAFTNQSGDDYAKRLLIDLRCNGGGQVRLGRQLLNFLFPNVGHPLYQTVDMTRTDLNEQLAKITQKLTEESYNSQEIAVDIDQLEIKPNFYTIVGVGAPYPINQDIRYDVGMATSGSVYNYKSVQEIKSNASLIESAKIDESKLPYKFYRIGTDLTWSNKGGYGFTDETNDQLLEYKIVDADFRVEYFPYNDQIFDEDEQRFALYDEVLKREKELLDADTPSPPNKCLSWEVETSNTQTPSKCKGCLRNDPYSIYGYPCSVRGSSEAKGRYSNGTAKIGEYLTDKCIFSHCKVGYYRKNILIGQKIDQKCSLVPLGPNQNRSEITPDQTEDEVKDSDSCNLHVIIEEQEEQEEQEEEEQQQQSDQDKQKEIETEEQKSKAEMISGIVVAGVIVVASIVAMIIVAVVIQHQKYSGLGRRGQQLISVDA